MTNRTEAAEVLVIGAGPTGLLLAGDLAEAGVPVTVLERRIPETSNLTRAFTVHARTLEALDARGLADDLVAAGERIGELELFLRMRLDLTKLPSRFPYLLSVPQYRTEELLLKRAQDAGAKIEHGAEVVDLRQDDECVVVEVRDASTGRTSTRSARYLVGADGHRSSVRNALRLPFPGTTAVKSIMLADVRLTDPPAGKLVAKGFGEAVSMVISFGDGWHRIMAWDRAHDRPAGDPLELDDVRELVVRSHGTDYGMHDPRWLSRFQADERQVPRYRVGRVFLAGDAAHVHTPAGGQGMNTGLQDAANLSWKLIAAVRGWAPDGLLDTYQTERWPVGRMVLRSSGAMLRLGLAPNRIRLAARSLAALVAANVGPINQRIRGMISGVGISYRAPRGAHPLTGRRAPDARLAGAPQRLYEALRGGRFVLITPAGTEPPVPADRVRVAHWASDDSRVLLVRPDGYIAWASDSGTGDLADALRHWAGARS